MASNMSAMDLDPSTDRLAILASHDIVDSLPEPEFDNIVALARKLCNAPIALISFVATDRQWFKARLGVSVSETPIDQSVCAIAIDEEELLVIPDLAADDRTKHNKLVTTEPRIRFYAGAVLRSIEGAALGTLCVIDTEPRLNGLTSDQLDSLRLLARQTMSLLELRRTVNNRQYALQRERRTGYDRRKVNQELSHRLKNTLAMVQAIASETLRSTGDRDALRRFDRRITALGKAHDLLLEQNWIAASMRAVVEAELAAHGERSRYQISGPDVNLDAKAVLNLSLVMHELATNAVKYGALSNATGRITLTWEIDGTGNDATLLLRWEETGGPPVREPTRKGFGTRLISMGLSGTGQSALRYQSTGLVAEFKTLSSTLTQVDNPFFENA